MNTFTITYTVDYKLSNAQEYVFTKDKECFNLKTGKRIKQSSKGGSIGYYIRGKFRTLFYLRKYLVKPEKQICPF